MKIQALGFVAAVLAAIPLRAAESEARIAFPNPGAAHSLRINAGRNRLIVRGADGNEIHAVSSQPNGQAMTTRPDGLRVLAPGTGISIVLENPSTALIDVGLKRPVDATTPAGVLTVTVPRSISLIVRSAFDGDITISDLTGDVEVGSMAGKVKIERLRGGAIVETNRGDIDASFSEVSGTKPLSFSSMVGAVVLRIPATAKAAIRLRSQDGQMLTDFMEDELVVAPRPEESPALETGNTMASIQGLQKGLRAAAKEKPVPPRGPNPAKNITAYGLNGSSFTGGHVIAGDLNGGGTEISITTLHGDVTLRKL